MKKSRISYTRRVERVSPPVPALAELLSSCEPCLILSMRNLRYSILALESCSIWCASASSFLSRWWPALMLCSMFSAPCFTLTSMLSCFSSATSLRSASVPSGALGGMGVKMSPGVRDRISCSSSSWSSAFSSFSLRLAFLTIPATSARDRRSVATSRSFSAPSLILSSLRISRLTSSLRCASVAGWPASPSSSPYLTARARTAAGPASIATTGWGCGDVIAPMLQAAEERPAASVRPRPRRRRPDTAADRRRQARPRRRHSTLCNGNAMRGSHARLIDTSQAIVQTTLEHVDPTVSLFTEYFKIERFK